MFRITARTVLELGSELISSDIIAFYELIKNGFDAGTKSGVEIHFNIVLRRNHYLSARDRALKSGGFGHALIEETLDRLNPEAATHLLESARSKLSSVRNRDQFLTAIDDVYGMSDITVSDTGTGMSLSGLTDNFLVIGTASRKREVDSALRRGDAKSPYLGEKGIGRLSAMRLGDKLQVETATVADDVLNVLSIDWADFSSIDAMLSDIDIRPSIGGAKPNPTWSGTRIRVGALAEDWTKARVKRMAEYDFARLTDPFNDPKRRPRVALFWNGERLDIPWMERALLNASHASIKGVYEIENGAPVLRLDLVASNLGFEHPKEAESSIVRSIDLQALLIGNERELPASSMTTIGPFKFEMYWFNRRLLSRIEGIGDLKAVRNLQERWSGILLFRDGFRVFPYGDDDDDWLGLDRKALRRSGYTLNKTQFIGRVEISRGANPHLVDQTNREGLRETSEQQVLIEILQYAIQDQLFRFMKHVEGQYKGQRLDLAEAKLEVEDLNKRARTAITQLRKLAPHAKAEVETLQQALLEFSEFADKARQRIEEVERQSKQMIEMAGVGLMVEIVAHELARASENALQNIEALRSKATPSDVQDKLASLRDQMLSLSKRIRVLDPLSVSGRQTSETFDLHQLIRETLTAHEAQFARHRISVSLPTETRPVKIRAVKGMIIQILENLISNSKYWMDMKSSREPSYKPKITIEVLDHPPTIFYADNGPGIAPENRERIFRSFFSLKEKPKRRGLGLFIGRECAEYLGGSLTLDEAPLKETGRLNRFILELPGSAVK
ncbi:ATP-binding protein [Acidovorax sp. PRC11]|uniref:sensor histidine kinase n=1 Tax=Acidovorax sp. PRC11 TaxID=2962592 RepID=UPI0028811B1F|nr:ATP-binding protein [Acidovorax sp. PRC11]MDT0136531.1 ATP-binding protein [Acidovorax sp. PRC11]